MSVDGQVVRSLADLQAWQRLAPLLTEYLPTPPDSIRPAALVALLDAILLDNRTVLLQCGCGPSTVLIARLLARRGFGRLLALEHDGRWASFITSQLRREGLSDTARIVHAPLAEHPDAVAGARWYDPERVYAEVIAYIDEFGLADWLLVDGPPAKEAGSESARYPALPVLRGALAPCSTVFVHGADRPGELGMLNQWATEYGVRFKSDPVTRLARALLGP